jgi:hypothetical protein
MRLAAPEAMWSAALMGKNSGASAGAGLRRPLSVELRVWSGGYSAASSLRLEARVRVGTIGA